MKKRYGMIYVDKQNDGNRHTGPQPQGQLLLDTRRSSHPTAEDLD